MKPTLWVVFLLLLVVLTGHAQEAKPAKKIRITPIHNPDPPLSDGVLARVNGAEITEAEFQSYIRRRTGMMHFQKFMDHTLVTRKARALGIALDEAELGKAVDSIIEREIDQVGGDPELFRKRLQRRFYNVESYRQLKLERLRQEMLLDRCVRSTRKVEADDVARKFEEMFGVDGVTHRVRHIMVSLTKHGREQAKARADEVVAKLERDPEVFAALVTEYSDHGPTRRSGGVIDGYRPGGSRRGSPFGENFDRAVEGLEQANQITGPIRSKSGFHIIQLLERKSTRLEDVADTIRDLLVSQDPTPKERREFIRRLHEDVRIEMNGFANE